MSARELVERKKRGARLERDEIATLIEDFTRGTVPDYQMAAFLMAVWFRGLDRDETLALTESMMRSGRVLELTNVPGPKIDKHSTGGIGDKVSLPLIGIAVACGLRVPMLSGRGLGHTGGTLDKLESIPGYSTEFDASRFERTLRDVGGSIVGQSDDLVPADRALYALRDVTATIDSIPLIVASILSKKFAAGVDGVVLDLKVGSGAFMRERGQAQELAEALVDVGEAFGRRVAVVFTRMDEPLGVAVGNALEVVESVQLLRDDGPADVREVTLTLAAEMLRLGGVEREPTAARARAEESLGDGRALECFRAIVEAHGGRLDWQRDDCGLRVAPCRASVRAPARGWLAAVDGYEVGMAVVALGGGRQRKSDAIDSSVGLRWHTRIGDEVDADAVVADVHADDVGRAEAAARRIARALGWSASRVAAPPRILGRYPEMDRS